MQLTTCTPRQYVRPVNRELRVFDDFFTPFSGLLNERSESTYLPSVDIYEKEEKLVIEAELPGFGKENITVNVEGKLLTLGGERLSKNEVKEESRFIKERRSGSFERTFKLPFEVTEEQISATYKDGLLSLVIEKPEEQKPKKITIN